MAHPYKSAGHKNDPKWIGELKGYDKGGAVTGYAGVKQLDRDPTGESEVTPVEVLQGQQRIDAGNNREDYPINGELAPTPQNARNEEWRQATKFMRGRRRGGKVSGKAHR